MRKLLLIVGVPLGHALLFGGYFLWSGEAAGTAMSILFAVAMGLMLYVLVPTVSDVGPTAPVDPAWGEPEAVVVVEPIEPAADSSAPRASADRGAAH